MSSEELVKRIEADEYILPAEIRKQVSDEQLLKDMEEIFRKYQSKLKSEESFRRKYIDIFAYLFSENLTGKTKLKFNDDMITTLLAFPETR
ncbi:MAG TPA: hypothetical protein VF572_06440 [Candidatus Saccharimonadales bacterium]|jgi:hypothetical protein